MADNGKPKARYVGSRPRPQARYVGPKIKRGASAVTAGETKVKQKGLETPHQKGMAKRVSNRLKARARGIQSGRMGQEQRILKSGGRASWLRGFGGGGGSRTAGQPLVAGPSKGRRPSKLQ